MPQCKAMQDEWHFVYQFALHGSQRAVFEQFLLAINFVM